MTSDLELRALSHDEVRAGGRVIAVGMAENPIHVAAWPDPAIRAQALTITFAAGLARPGRWALGALASGELIGVAGIAPDGSCRPSGSQKSGLRDRLAELGPGVAERYREWREAWYSHDPGEPHWHFGPFAVLPGHRRRGFGRALFKEYCCRLDAAGAAGYLEVDREENLGFYAAHGFAVVARDEALGVPTWFMWRDPERAGPATVRK